MSIEGCSWNINSPNKEKKVDHFCDIHFYEFKQRKENTKNQNKREIGTKMRAVTDKVIVLFMGLDL